MSLQSVTVRRESVAIPTYQPLPPDRNPMFLERRVYQGSSGRVYPLPFYNRIADTAVERTWDAITIENEFLRVMVLPEIGGRIHIGQDKTNGYHFFYHQDAIKPALVGLAGPWASGGVEINWPQHHRPATFMPVDTFVEEHADGSKTVWLSDHDPMERMKGMHGVCLHPDRAVIELKVRAYNRTPHVQTFLWWANVATRVHEGYQSFFPPDVTCVADHAKRAMSRFPLCDGQYYGVNYGERAAKGVPPHERPKQFVPPHCRPDDERPAELPAYAPNDLSWYANIPVPTSYMCLGSKEDFSGGYDHFAQAGLVQVSNHHISPGKKQWTWGNHDFGYAWDRNLTDNAGPYIELMLGVYTDNQPDFSYLQPGETKTWSVYWYPIQRIGPAQKANEHAAVSLVAAGRERSARIGVAVTARRPGLRIELSRRGRVLRRWTHDGAPNLPFVDSVPLPAGVTASQLLVTVCTAEGAELLRYAPVDPKAAPLPPPATEPLPPEAIASADELYVTGLHLWQYRHATRSPVLYWEEALRRDPGDSRCNTAMGRWHLRRGEFARAESYFRAGIERLVLRNPNPAEGEAFYHLGLTLRFLHRDDDAYDAFYKATWNQAWQSASFHALAEIDCTRRTWAQALDHLDQSLRLNTDNLRARNLRARVLRELGRSDEAERAVEQTLALDPLDGWARYLRGETLTCDAQTRLDLALDSTRAGFRTDAIELLERARDKVASARGSGALSDAGTAPLIDYHLAQLHAALGLPGAAKRAAKRAAKASPDYCFPARLEDMIVLEAALERAPDDARAAYYLGNLYYDRRRHAEAIECWERSVRHDPTYSVAWRNLGIAYFNVMNAPARALRAYERALRADPKDARVFYERDQLWKRVGRPVRRRLRELERRPDLVAARDDATIELCSLYNQVGRPEKALALLSSRRFQPWEGGEGQTLGQYVRACLLLGRAALARHDAAEASRHFGAALAPPANLGEARHLLANPSDIHYWLGRAHAACGEAEAARRHWETAASFRGDFQEMSVRSYSELTYYSALSLRELGRRAEAKRLLEGLRNHARELMRTPAKIDYFATSLPTMLLFEDDLTARQNTTGLFMLAQAELGLGRRAAARRHLHAVLARDPSHGPAADLLADGRFEI